MNSTIDLLLFHTLLEQVSLKFRATQSTQHASIKDWKGQDIINFQDDLRSKTGSSVSEKWFYTYVKNEPEKLPRIDILNMLSQYAGSDSWSAFAKANEKNTEQIKSKEPKHLRSKKRYKLSIISICITFLFFLYSQMNKKYEHQICFVDYYQNDFAVNNIEIELINVNESETYQTLNELGCLKIKASESIIKLVVSSPYYRNDTITRHIKKNGNEIIKLKPDDYALMLDYYSNSDIKNLRKRRNQLDELLHKEVIIMELLPYEIGVTIYDKEQFIDKLTTPTQSLKKLEILDTEYVGEQIKKIKFRIKS